MTKIDKYQYVIDLLQEIVTEEKHLNPFLKEPIKFLRQRIVFETKVINFNNKKNESLHFIPAVGHLE